MVSRSGLSISYLLCKCTHIICACYLAGRMAFEQAHWYLLILQKRRLIRMLARLQDLRLFGMNQEITLLFVLLSNKLMTLFYVLWAVLFLMAYWRIFKGILMLSPLFILDICFLFCRFSAFVLKCIPMLYFYKSSRIFRNKFFFFFYKKIWNTGN